VIPRAIATFLRRSVGPLSSVGGVERDAQLLGGRILYRGRSIIPSYSSPAAISISSPMVSSLLQISGDGGGSGVFFDGLGRRLVMLFLIAFGMELLGVSMVELFGCVGDSVANNGFGFQEAAHGHPMDGLPGFGTGLLPPLVAAALEFYPCGGQRGGGRWAFTIADASLEVLGAGSCGIFQDLVLPVAVAVD
jgi:hypothetical protein